MHRTLLIFAFFVAIFAVASGRFCARAKLVLVTSNETCYLPSRSVSLLLIRGASHYTIDGALVVP